jgi:hypothetical protein
MGIRDGGNVKVIEPQMSCAGSRSRQALLSGVKHLTSSDRLQSHIQYLDLACPDCRKMVGGLVGLKTLLSKN